MKNNWLKYLILLATFIGGNIFSMPQPRSLEELKIRKDAAARAQSDLKQKAIEEREKRYQPNAYFVYQEGTSRGIPVDQDFLEKNSEYVRDLIKNNNGVKPKEIGVPFTFEVIDLMFGILFEKARPLTLEKWNEIIEVARYLKMSSLMMTIIFKYCPGYFIYYKGAENEGIAVHKPIIESNCNIELLKEKEVMIDNKISIFLDNLRFSYEVSHQIVIKDVVQALNYDLSSEFLKDFLQGLSAYRFMFLLNCIQYLEVKNKDIFIEEACDRIENIGDRFIALISELFLNDQARSLLDVKKDVPDYKFFEYIDSGIEKIILEKLRSKNNTIIDRFIQMPWQSDPVLARTILDSKDSITGLLDVFYTKFALLRMEREKQEEAKKWFWQRKWFGRYGEEMADKIKWKLKYWQWKFLGR